MRLYSLLIIAGVGCGLAWTSTLAGDTYSCFSEFESTATNGCKSRVNGADGSYEQETKSDISNMDFCLSGPVYGQAKQGSFGKAKNYLVSADLKMTDFDIYSTGYGFLGLAFNMMDSQTYDIVYVRPHAKDHCWELGHVENGLFYGRDFGSCDKSVSKDFNLAIKIESGMGTIYIDGMEQGSFTPFYPSVNKVATALRNNMVATMLISNLELCHEIDCVSRNNAGETVYTKPGEYYQDAGMSECEACTCQLYGQIRCGCRSAEEQGVTCTGSMIAAVGHDCCARCVPPSATCYGTGDPHYRTWDGRSYDFQGSCTYCLAKTIDFEVRQKNKNFGSVSINEYCQLLFDGDQFEMRGGLSWTPEGEGERGVATPFTKYYNTEDYVTCTSGSMCSVYIKGEKMLGVTCSYGSVNLWIHGTYYERTQCLCGTWDGDSGNDFQDRNDNNVGSPNAMAAAWKVANDDGCPNPPDPTDPCEEVDRATRNWAEQYCSRYKQEPFKSCPVDVTQYFENCMFDACTDPSNDENVCENAQAYAKACQDAGHPVIGWRSNSFCPMDCDETFVYDTCGRGCFPSCADPAPADCVDTCVADCYCPSGTVIENGTCIDSADCQCLFEGQFIENGQSWNDSARCETCMCMDGGIIECSPQACNSCPEGLVPVSKSGLCCPICLADWAQELEERIELTEQEGPAEFQCVLHDDVLVAPDAVTWKYSSGEEITADNKPDNFEFDSSNLILTINPAGLLDDNEYIAEVIYNGVVGQCTFDLVVNPIPAVDYIDIDGESPRVVRETECQTMSVQVMGDFDFTAQDFTWTSGPAGTPIDFSSDKYTKSNGGKTMEVCDATETDEGMYECCVTKDDITDCVEIELRVLAICQTDDEETYEEGESWMDGDYSNCTCTSLGESDCFCVDQNLQCGEGEEMYYDDVCEAHCSREPATCIVTGDPHYKTFDGYRHDFQGGSCRFTIVKTDDFQVIGTNNHRVGIDGNINGNVSWNDAVDIHFKSLDIHLGPEGEVTVNDADVFLPYAKTWRTKQSVSIIKAGSSVVVTIGLGNDLEALDLIWDGNSTVSTTIHGKYYEDTTGLCGVWDDIQDNDQTGKDGTVYEENDLNSFGWSWKYTEGSETCEEEPQPPHPCDEAIFSDAQPIADEACDILYAAPFTACHELVDTESALYNCKYDTCSCFDSSCACHAIKSYVKECQEAGVNSLGSWRDFATFCPMPCDEGLYYDPCGSFCPGTCADKTPDCGKLTDQCNEGCFCPKDTYLQNGTCVFASECMCEFNGTFIEVGETWHDPNICKDCACRAEGEVICESVQCEKCDRDSQQIYEGDDCCPTCITDWIWTEELSYENVTQHTDLVISCYSIVKPNKIDWSYSADDGETWELLNKTDARGYWEDGLYRLTYTITDLMPGDDGLYKCWAKKNYRSKEGVMLVTAGEEADTCTAVAPDHGLVEPEVVQIGASVTYNCEDDYYMQGDATSVCLEDGTIESSPECLPIEQITFTTTVVIQKKGNKATLKCSTPDNAFGRDAIITFYFVGDGDAPGLELIDADTTYSKSKGSAFYTIKSIDLTDMPGTAMCSGASVNGEKFGSATFPIEKTKKSTA